MTYDELYRQTELKQTSLCIGLDSDIEKIPTHLLKYKYPLYEFNKAIVQATASLCVAYKPNTAFYEAQGHQGWKQLEMTVAYIRRHYPEIFLIADAKRGDIGNTADKYAEAFFQKMDFDAVTLSPYMGFDAIQPFLRYDGKWAIVLALTSNASAFDFQMTRLSEEEERYMFEKIIKRTSTEVENCYGHHHERLMFVVGATHPKILQDVRAICPDNFLLVPGVGAQGGDLNEVTKFGLNSHCGLLINSSRNIIYASSGKNFDKKSREEATKFQKISIFVAH